MPNIFLDNPLVKDFILVNTSNQSFNLTSGSKNIPPGAAGNLRAFDVDFCELKYKYSFLPSIKEIFDMGWLVATPIQGSSAITCAWESTIVNPGSGGGGTANSNAGGMILVSKNDEAATYLYNSIVTEPPLFKEIISSPLAGGGIDEQLKLSFLTSILPGVGSFSTYDYAATTTDATPFLVCEEVLSTGSHKWDIHIHAVSTAGTNVGKRVGMRRELHVAFHNGVDKHLLQSAFTSPRPTGWNFTVQPTTAGIKFFVTGDALSTITWKLSILKSSLLL